MRVIVGLLVFVGLFGAPSAWALKCKQGPVGASVDGREDVPVDAQFLVALTFLDEGDPQLIVSARGQKPVPLKVVQRTPASVVVAVAESLQPGTAYTLTSKEYKGFSVGFTTGAKKPTTAPDPPRVTGVERRLDQDDKFAQVDALVVETSPGDAAYHEVQLSVDGKWTRVFGGQTIRIGSVPCRNSYRAWSSKETVVEKARIRGFDHAGNASDWVPFDVPKPGR